MTKQKTQRFRNRFWLPVLLVWLVACSRSGADLEAKYDICFKEDTPGATSRYVTFTPVRCSDKTVALGEPIGGEFARLEFADADSDGVSEIVVSSEFWCRWGFEPCISPSRTTVKVEPGNPPVFVVIGDEKLPGGDF